MCKTAVRVTGSRLMLDGRSTPTCDVSPQGQLLIRHCTVTTAFLHQTIGLHLNSMSPTAHACSPGSPCVLVSHPLPYPAASAAVIAALPTPCVPAGNVHRDNPRLRCDGMSAGQRPLFRRACVDSCRHDRRQLRQRIPVQYHTWSAVL